jgi:aldose 1-epimerase
MDAATPAGLITREFGRLADGRVVHEVTLTDGEGRVLVAITLGGIVTQLHTPDRAGRVANVVLGFDRLEDYVERNPHFGVIVGRYANRIAGASMQIDGETFALDRNDGANCLHGGRRGFGTQLWEIESARAHDAALGGPALTLRHVSADGEQGFPGRVEARVTYALRGGGRWQVDYEARTDRATVVNLSHHDYFNLADAGAGTVTGHVLTLPASRYNPIDAGLIPTGIAAVAGTPFDFRAPTAIGARVDDDDPQLALAGGYDHDWIVDDTRDDAGDGTLRLAARLEDPVSGRTLELRTTEPAIQCYSGNFLDGTLRGHGGTVYGHRSAVCLEPQHAPDSPHHADWPSTILRPGEIYRSRSVYTFGASPREPARPAPLKAGTA